MCAAARGNLELVQLLLESGASLNRRDTDGFNAWAWASDKGAEDVAQFLATKGAQQYVLDGDAG
jgi:ankyrin repeat protein